MINDFSQEKRWNCLLYNDQEIENYIKENISLKRKRKKMVSEIKERKKIMKSLNTVIQQQKHKILHYKKILVSKVNEKVE